MAAYNFARRLKTLRGLTLYEYICKIWTSEPERFILNTIHQMPGLDTNRRPLSHGQELRLGALPRALEAGSFLLIDPQARSAHTSDPSEPQGPSAALAVAAFANAGGGGKTPLCEIRIATGRVASNSDKSTTATASIGTENTAPAIGLATV